MASRSDQTREGNLLRLHRINGGTCACINGFEDEGGTTALRGRDWGRNCPRRRRRHPNEASTRSLGDSRFARSTIPVCGRSGHLEFSNGTPSGTKRAIPCPGNAEGYLLGRLDKTKEPSTERNQSR